MTIPQRDLWRELARNLARRGVDIGDKQGWDDDCIERLRRLDRDALERPTLVVALRAFDVVEYVRGFASALDRMNPAELHEWYGNFTKSIFLAGDPSRFSGRVAAQERVVTSERWAMAFVGPTQRFSPLVRLLRPIRTAALPVLHDCDIALASAPARGVEVRVNTSLMTTLEQYLVALSHTLADAWCDGHLAGDTSLRLRHIEMLDSFPEQRLLVRIQRRSPDTGDLAIATCVVAM